jgi:putative glutamine amidotransferase
MNHQRPPIAITGKTGVGPTQGYLRAVEMAGGQPFAIERAAQLEEAAGLLLSGGGDVQAWRYHRAPHPAERNIDKPRDELELELVGEALRRDLAILAICRGMQVLAVACGGALWQDLPSQLAVEHELDEVTRHQVLLEHGSVAATAMGATSLTVNSRHHQAVQIAPRPLVITGWASDGIIEAIEIPAARFVLGVQWHPEGRLDCVEHLVLFRALVGAGRVRFTRHRRGASR